MQVIKKLTPHDVLIYSALLWGVTLLAILPASILGRTSSLLVHSLFIFQLIVLLSGLYAGCRSLSTVLYNGDKKLLSFVMSALIIVALIIIAIEGAHPITTRDALIHHLAAPKLWVEHGSIYPISWHEWSFYPMLLSMPYITLEEWGLSRFAFLFHFACLFISAAIIAQLCFKLTSDKVIASTAALILITVPVCIKLSSTPLVDLGLTLFTLIALERILSWASTADRPTSLLIQAGIALGLAMGVKYNGLLTTFVILIFFPMLSIRSQSDAKASAKAFVIISLTAAVVFLPWAVKNYIWTGNPIYPLYGSLFGGSLEPGAVSGISPLAHRIQIYGESLTDLLLTPFKMMFLAKDNDPKLYDGVLSPILILLFIPLIRSKRTPWISYVLLVMTSYFLLALLTSSWRIRYLAPLYAPAVLLTCYGLYLLKPFITYWGVAILVVIHLFVFGSYSQKLLKKSHATDYLLGNISDQNYLERKVPEYKMAQIVNASTVANAKIYLLQTTNEFYYYNRTVFTGGYYSEGPLVRWIKQAKTAEAIAQEFHARQITHLLVHIERSNRALAAALNPEEQQRFREFQQAYLIPQEGDGQHLLLAIK